MATETTNSEDLRYRTPEGKYVRKGSPSRKERAAKKALYRAISERAEALGRAELAEIEERHDERPTTLGWAAHLFRLAERYGRLAEGSTYPEAVTWAPTPGTAHWPEPKMRQVPLSEAIESASGRRLEFAIFGGRNPGVDQLIGDATIPTGGR